MQLSIKEGGGAIPTPVLEQYFYVQGQLHYDVSAVRLLIINHCKSLAL
jgi:hypothetical protein